MSTSDDKVEDDQRERKTRRGSSEVYIPTKGLSGKAGETGVSRSKLPLLVFGVASSTGIVSRLIDA